jgi:Tol biopolymer transport system component
MEFVRGRTLEVVLRDHGPFGAQEATLIGLDLCRALSAVHSGGLIHRDVKAQNVMRETGGRIVLMDFGTGREVFADRPVDLAGTPLYLAPEVFGGTPASAQSDIYSVGVLVFHLVTGSYPVTGATVGEIREAHDGRRRLWLRDARPDLPDTFVHAVERALDGDPDQRYESSGAMEAALARVMSTTGPRHAAKAPTSAKPPEDTHGPPTRTRWAWNAGAAVALAAAIAAVVMTDAWRYRGRRADAPEPGKITFEVQTPLTPAPNMLALSRDGTHLAATVSSETGNVLWLRALDRLEGRAIPGTEGAGSLFWSPDGRSIAFVADGTLKTVDIDGGAPQAIAEGGRGAGGAWNQQGMIIFGGASGEIFRVHASGGKPVPVTEVDPARGEVSHRHPQFLPDGVHFLFLAMNANVEDSAIYVGSLESMERRRILGAPVRAMFASGHLLFMRKSTPVEGGSGALMAQRFDPVRLKLAGDAFRVADAVGMFPRGGAAGFTVSDTGVLAYRRSAWNDTVLTWFDRSGKPIGSLGDRGRYGGVQISHDGTQAAVPILDDTRATYDLWLYDLTRGTRRQFTFDPAEDSNPVWSHDDSQIVFSSRRGGPFYRLYVKHVSGGGDETVLLEAPNHVYPSDWSSDGRSMLYLSGLTGAPGTLGVLPFAGDRKPHEFGWSALPRGVGWSYFSPDGRWLAYTSTESGREEIYVVPSDGSAGRWRVSRASGAFPRWRRDGREIYYLEANSKLMAVAVDGRGSAFHVGAVTGLFPIVAPALAARGYDVAPDGQRFLVNALAPGSQGSLTVVVNWTAALPK